MSDPTHFYIRCARLFSEQGIQDDVFLEIQNGVLATVSHTPEHALPLLDVGELRVIPGLIDLHIHGREGCDVMDATPDAIDTISRSLGQHGVTGFLGTTVTSTWQQTLLAFKNLGEAFHQHQSGAQLLGAYNEGLFFCNEHKGAHNEEYFVPLNQENLDAIIKEANGALKVVALAPERQNSEQMIRYLRSQGIRVMLGHTNANWQQTRHALDAGACGGVHVFNGMRGIHHREPGCAGAVLLDPNALVEVIADGVHLHPAILDLIHRLKGKKRMALISDCINAGGLDDGQYRLGMMDVEVLEGVARTQSGSLAGSTLTLEKAVANLTNMTDIDPLDAIHMASLVPAEFLGLSHQIGSIRPGKQADLAIVNENYEVYATMVKGVFCFKHASFTPAFEHKI